jgi:hypothetical protein
VSPALYHGIFMLKSNVEKSIELDTIMCANWLIDCLRSSKQYFSHIRVRVVHICVFWVLVWPCQLVVRLWYRVTDVLDLSLVSKRFGFWPHITHVYMVWYITKFRKYVKVYLFWYEIEVWRKIPISECVDLNNL